MKTMNVMNEEVIDDPKQGFMKSLNLYKFLRWSKENEASCKVNGLDWDVSGEHLITSCDDNMIRMYNMNGTLKYIQGSQKYGCCLAQFMPDAKSIIYASTIYGSVKNNHKIRHLDMTQNRLIHYYAGHDHQVTSLHVNHKHNCSISSSEDSTVCLWDARLNCHRPDGDRSPFGVLKTNSPSFCQFDPTGMVFAVGTNREMEDAATIRMYDLRNYMKGPFLNKPLPSLPGSNSRYTQFKFSPNGIKLALSTTSSQSHKILILDSFTCEDILANISDFDNALNIDLEMSWSMDSSMVFVGSSVSFPSIGGIKLNVFNALTGDKLNSWSSMHEASIRCVKPNPRYFSLATACHDVGLWQPSMDQEDDVNNNPQHNSIS